MEIRTVTCSVSIKQSWSWEHASKTKWFLHLRDSVMEVHGPVMLEQSSHVASEAVLYDLCRDETQKFYKFCEKWFGRFCALIWTRIKESKEIRQKYLKIYLSSGRVSLLETCITGCILIYVKDWAEFTNESMYNIRFPLSLLVNKFTMNFFASNSLPSEEFQLRNSFFC